MAGSARARLLAVAFGGAMRSSRRGSYYSEGLILRVSAAWHDELDHESLQRTLMGKLVEFFGQVVYP
eukprot:CAMPEP_0170411178 /NCGR_PEP_ID=MMETSP0117_2-20130122/30289_1 /TAXON_ID=400756 /ORGANISM="Durinskia baltica, Strain CSIRO CS-38" /LENGTH=66 /DNA_ID=CAMNT_0010668769 /DNA_START=167 /DNA_END=367 /DNA_ORIENTATION=-